MRVLSRCAAVMVLTLPIHPLAAWTTPQIISNAGTGKEASVPRVATGFGGRVLVAYQQKDWRVRYRERSAGGTWGNIEVISPAGVFSVRPVVIEDASEHPRVIYAENDAGGVLDLVDLCKVQGAWQRTKITNTSDRWDDFPSVGVDAFGRLHLVYVDYIDGQGGNIVYRRWDSGSWSSATTLGSTDSPYYRRPDLSVDSAGNVHVAWATTGGDKYVVHYRRTGTSGWSVTKVIGQSINQSFVGTVRIGALSSSSIVVAWDDGSGRYVSSSDGGTAWTAAQTWSNFAVSNIQAGQGTAWMCGHDRNDRSRVLMTQWLGSAWSAAQRANPGETRWKGWGDGAIAPDSSLHVVYDDVVDDANTHEIAYVMQGATAATGTVSGVVRDQSGPLPGVALTGSLGGYAATDAQGRYSLTSPTGTITLRAYRPGYPELDIPNVTVNQGQITAMPDILMTAAAPEPVGSFVLAALNTEIRLSWQNPVSPNFIGTMVRFRTDRFPTGPTDGSLLADRAGSPAGLETLAHPGLTNGQTYYYALFTHDDRPVRSYSAAVTGLAIPHLAIDCDRDGDVDQGDFGLFQACFSGPFVPQTDVACTFAMLDDDNDVDQDDLARFLACMSGPGVTANPACTD